ncbi:MAG: DUF2911 domain-containing protein [Candidatus Sulfotelmatobacter sp.]
MVEGEMEISNGMRKLICCAAVLLGTATVLVTVPLSAHHAANENSEALQMVKDECAFSDGSTISFGHKASGADQSGNEVWRAGNYVATAFRVTERMRIPPLDAPIDVPAGRYTLFVDPSKGEPWTLIISKKTGKSGMLYPGKHYDVGRTQMGFDDSSRPPVANFIVGCTQHKDAPIFIWMASEIHVTYAKIEAVSVRNGETEYLWH